MSHVLTVIIAGSSVKLDLVCICYSVVCMKNLIGPSTTMMSFLGYFLIVFFEAVSDMHGMIAQTILLYGIL